MIFFMDEPPFLYAITLAIIHFSVKKSRGKLTNSQVFNEFCSQRSEFPI
jgi:hypothetical protein